MRRAPPLRVCITLTVVCNAPRGLPVASECFALGLPLRLDSCQSPLVGRSIDPARPCSRSNGLLAQFRRFDMYVHLHELNT
mmetsp:Transcript_4565/g.12120  ORF Transcript_4565/g.12120 Transcript_4565/m.12120 type:complete len:81 (-) Transcript_4565:70-312(-)